MNNEMNNEIKVLATDLDGTLLYPKDRKNIIYKNNLYFLQSIIDKGWKVIIVSGRSLIYGKRIKEIINRDISIVSFNGGALYQDNEIKYSKAIDNKEAQDIYNDINNGHSIIATLIFTDDGIYCKGKWRTFISSLVVKCYGKLERELAEKISTNPTKFIDAFNNKKIYKILFIFGVTKKSKIKAMETNKIIRNSYDNLESSWSSGSIEVTGKGINKARIIKEYCKINNINPDNVYVVGDSGNDIPMFKEFHEHSFVMEHSPDSVKKYAKYNISKFEDLSRYIYEK